MHSHTTSSWINCKADSPGLVGILMVAMAKSNITKCYQLKVVKTHTLIQDYAVLDINQPPVGDDREADTDS